MLLDEGFDGYISKPVNISALEQALKENLPKELISDNKTGMTVVSDNGGKSQNEEEKTGETNSTDKVPAGKY